MFARYQQAVLANSADQMAEVFAPDGVTEFPFRLPGIPPRVEGREGIRAWLTPAVGTAFRFEEYRDVVVHDTTDPEVIVVEHSIAGTTAANGQPAQISYVYVLRARDGEIVHLRDYANPIEGMRAAEGMGLGATASPADQPDHPAPRDPGDPGDPGDPVSRNDPTVPDPMAEPTTPREVYAALVRAIVAADADAAADLYAEDGVLELVFTRPGIVPRRQGREDIREAARAGWDALPLRFESHRTVALHDSPDPEVVIAEFELAGTSLAGGRAFTLSMLVILRVRDGHIVHQREYVDVLGIAAASDRLPAVLASLTP
ncbi:ketosteroid isomerase-like protein [Actinopolymorpha pittospori]|uniref:Ketosteroid isomerase-like protein n=1 Tax=Actinopolymorpha pittospori TaxID=648752 RepID=A0A927RR61_9ACTN|nr:ketosteroid isomerase-like protein [Actinopolymorpha pittospori]